MISIFELTSTFHPYLISSLEMDKINEIHNEFTVLRKGLYHGSTNPYKNEMMLWPSTIMYISTLLIHMKYKLVEYQTPSWEVIPYKS